MSLITMIYKAYLAFGSLLAGEKKIIGSLIHLLVVYGISERHFGRDQIILIKYAKLF